MTEKSRTELFFDFILAAMNDAAIERKLTQLKTTITPPGRKTPSLVRIIIVPETMDMEWPEGLGKKQ